MMKKQALLNVLFCCMAASAFAYDAFQDKLQRPSANKQDVDSITRPPTGALQSGDIKDFRDKLGLVQTQLFKDGTLPKGSTLRADNKDNPNSFRVQTPFSQLSENAQTQILKQMPEAKSAAGPLVLGVALDKGTARIDSVKVSNAPLARTPLAASVAKAEAPARVAVAPRAAPDRASVTSSFRPQPVTKTVDTTGAQILSKLGGEPARSFSHMALPDAARLLVGNVATVLVSENHIVVSDWPTRARSSPPPAKTP